MDLRVWADLAQIVGVALGAAVALFAWHQIRAARLIQREATARETYANYLRLAFEHPELSNSPDASSSPAYRWFVPFMLMACEQVLESYPDDPAWRAVVERQLSYHAAYLRSARSDIDPAHYSPQIKELLARA